MWSDRGELGSRPSSRSGSVVSRVAVPSDSSSNGGGWRLLQVRDAAEHVADLAHRGGRVLVVTGDVADDQRRGAVDEERVVPVPADGGGGRRRQVAHDDLQVVGLR